MTPPPMVFAYRDWNTGYGEPLRVTYDEAEARRRFAADETFCLLIGDELRPEIVLEVEAGGRQITVMWLDGLARPELIYLFAQPPGISDDELFLERTHLHDYDHDRPLPEGRPTYDEVWSFKADGSLWGSRGPRGGPSERTEGRLEPDQMLVHRERRPSFGEWEALLVRER